MFISINTEKVFELMKKTENLYTMKTIQSFQ